MSLTMLVYIIGLIPRLDAILFDILVFNLIVIIIVIMNLEFGNNQNVNYDKKWLKKIISVFCILAVFKAALPNERTMYMMAGAYTAQKLASSETGDIIMNESGKITAKIISIVNSKLDNYIGQLNQLKTEGE